MLKKIFDLNMKMASISRYSQTHLIMNESVLEHTGCVSIMCYFIAKSIDAKINIGELLTRAAIHDIDEIVTGDIPTTTKYKNPDITKAIKFVESENMSELSYNILGSAELFNTWGNAKDDTIEGAILATADLLAVLYKLWQETVLYNNRTMKEHIENIGNALVVAANKYSDDYNMTGIYKQAFDIYAQVKQNTY